MTRIILVRHGETDWNSAKRYQGYSDIALNQKGIEQAKLAAERLAGENIHAVYSSDLKRAVQTADYIASKHGLLVQKHSGFREIHFGRWEGYTYKQAMADNPDLLTAIYNGKTEVCMPEGESFRLVQKRAVAALDECIEKYLGCTFVVVAHGGALCTMICKILGKSLSEMWSIEQKYTAISIIEYDNGKGEFRMFNDNKHLWHKP